MLIGRFEVEVHHVLLLLLVALELLCVVIVVIMQNDYPNKWNHEFQCFGNGAKHIQQVFYWRYFD